MAYPPSTRLDRFIRETGPTAWAWAMMSLLILTVGIWLLYRFGCEGTADDPCLRGYETGQFVGTLLIAGGIMACALFLCVVIVHGLHASRMNQLQLDIGRGSIPPIANSPVPVLLRGDAYLTFALACVLACVASLIAVLVLSGTEYIEGVTLALFIEAGVTAIAATLLFVAAVKTRSVGQAMWSRWAKGLI